KKETAAPGYYSVWLEDYGIQAELTVTPRVGVHRYTFPETKKANIILDLDHRDKVTGSVIRIVGDREIEGFRRSTAWAKDQHIYFVIRFSKPVTAEIKKVDGRYMKAAVRFRTHANETITVKVGISAVDIDGARKNLETEAGRSNFNQIRTAAENQWQQSLNKIKTYGGTIEQKRIFYTALYHALLNPNLYT
ncbi:MAG: glycoside hydrolase family 92 protein, partial [bacterium]|nr:glycoside hydrolase family 92 protein [bacterium]